MVSLVSSSAQAEINPDPIEGVIARLDDPAVVESIHALIDHLDLLSTLVVGIDELFKRGDTIVDSLAVGLDEFRQVERPPLNVAQMLDLGRQVADATPSLLEMLPVVERLAASDLGNPALIDLAGLVSRAAVRGATEAQTERPSITGLRSMLKVLKDEDVSRALGFFVSVLRSVGQELRAGDPAASK